MNPLTYFLIGLALALVALVLIILFRTLDFPVVSGNVSLYNETNGRGIPPTPAIGGVGLIPDIERTMDVALKRAGDLLVLIGREQGHLGQSLYQQIVPGA